jgi:hypothetical protein
MPSTISAPHGGCSRGRRTQPEVNHMQAQRRVVRNGLGVASQRVQLKAIVANRGTRRYIERRSV